MERGQDSSGCDFLVDTGHRCFLCLKDGAVKKSESCGVGVGVSLCSFQKVSRYLEMDWVRLFSSKFPVPVEYSERVEGANFQMKLCEECRILVGRLELLCNKLEDIQRDIGALVKCVQGKIKSADGRGLMQIFKENATTSKEEFGEERYSLVKAAREEVLDKCDLQLKRISGNVGSDQCNEIEKYKSLQTFEQRILQGSKFWSCFDPDIVEVDICNDTKLELGLGYYPFLELFEEIDPKEVCAKLNVCKSQDCNKSSRNTEQCDIDDSINFGVLHSSFPSTFSGTNLSIRSSQCFNEEHRVEEEEELPNASPLPITKVELLCRPPTPKQKDNATEKSVQLPAAVAAKPELVPVQTSDPAPLPKQVVPYRYVKNTKMFVCTSCPASFRLKQQILFHHKIAHLNLRFKCSRCEEFFLKKCSLVIHRQSCSGPSTNLDSNGLPAQNSTEVVVSSTDATKSGSSLCHLCDRSFPSENNLKHHQKMFHPEARKFPCNMCPSVFKHANNLKAHQEAIHFGRRFSCAPDCSKSYTSKFTLRQHQKSCHVFKKCLESGVNGSNESPSTSSKSKNAPPINGQIDPFQIQIKSVMSLAEETEEVAPGTSATGAGHADIGPIKVERTDEMQNSEGDILEICESEVEADQPSQSQIQIPPEEIRLIKQERMRDAQADSTMSEEEEEDNINIINGDFENSESEEGEVPHRNFVGKEKDTDPTTTITKNGRRKQVISFLPETDSLPTCRICGKRFYTSIHLGTHLKRWHSEDKKFACGICHKFFNQQKYLMQHWEHAHTRLKNYCVVGCRKEFVSEIKLKLHQKHCTIYKKMEAKGDNLASNESIIE